MIFPNVFALVKSSSACTAIIGSSPCRCYEGTAPQGAARPYVVVGNAGGAPENYVGELPGVDSYRMQLDAFALTASEVRSLATAIRNAIEPSAHMIGTPLGPIFESDTKLFRVMLEFDFWIRR